MKEVHTYISRMDGWNDGDIPWEIEFCSDPPQSGYITIPVYTCDEDPEGVIYTQNTDLFSKMWKAYWEIKND